MTVVEYPKDKCGKKAIEVELFIFEENKILTQEDFESFSLIKERESDNFWIIEHNMVGNQETLASPMLISKIEMPLKGDAILTQQIDGNYSMEIAQKNLSNKDLYEESKRTIFKIICSTKHMNVKWLNNITTKKWKHDDKFYIECENKIYNKSNRKEVDYIFYESNNVIFKIKEPMNIL